MSRRCPQGPKEKKTQNTHKNTPTQNNQPKQTTQTTKERGQSGRLASSKTSVIGGGDIIVSSMILVWRKQQREKKHITDKAIPQPVSKVTQHYAETRAPPSQEPRDHIERAARASKLTEQVNSEASNDTAM